MVGIDSYTGEIRIVGYVLWSTRKKWLNNFRKSESNSQNLMTKQSYPLLVD